MLEHLVDIERLTKEEILSIVDLAKKFKSGELSFSDSSKTVAMMFCENSTRTKCSFEIAAQKLKMNVLNFDTLNSSIAKGESLKDTIENLYFLGVDAVVIRHALSGIIDNVINYVKYPIKFINAGDGNRAHPTQALLDFYTMIEKLGSIEGKNIAIIGDIKHSRVVKSNISLLSKFNTTINLCAPTYFKPEEASKYPVTWHNKAEEAIKNADVIMVLRVQNERHAKEIYPKSFEYKRCYEITSEFLKKFAKKDVIIMHPGPANRNVEISSELLDSRVGQTILEQARNGVFVRMAVLYKLLSEGGNNAS